MEPICPLCEASGHVHESRTRFWHDLPGLLLLRRPYRCYACGERFLSRTIAKARPRQPAVPRDEPAIETRCPNCLRDIKLLLSPDARSEAYRVGWYVSCPSCSAAFVYHPK